MRKLLLPLLFFLLFAMPAGAEIIISEVMASNGVYKNGEAYDWIELYNAGEKSVNLSGCYLSDSQKNVKKWAFPDKTTLKAGGYLLVYCTGEEMSPGKNATFYANFKLSSSGETILLTKKEWDLMLLFAQNPGAALYRETIYERVWGGEYPVGSRVVDLHIQRLRKKIGWEDKLQTVNRVGYRLEL